MNWLISETIWISMNYLQEFHSKPLSKMYLNVLVALIHYNRIKSKQKDMSQNVTQGSTGIKQQNFYTMSTIMVTKSITHKCSITILMEQHLKITEIKKSTKFLILIFCLFVFILFFLEKFQNNYFLLVDFIRSYI